MKALSPQTQVLNQFSIVSGSVLLCATILLIVTGCVSSAPVYETVTKYEPPATAAGQAAVASCETQKSECESLAEQAFVDCVDAAEMRAEEDYERQLKIYKRDFPDWEAEYEELGCGSTNTPTIRQDLCIKKLDDKPVKPDLDIMKSMYSIRARNSECPRTNTCEDEYNTCYQQAGGVVTIESECTDNCDGSVETGPLFQVQTDIPQGTGLIYIYRAKRFMSGGRKIDVKADGEKIAEICNGCIYPYLAMVGSTQIAFNYGGIFSRDQSLPPLNVQSGKTYFIQLDAGGRDLEFKIMPETNARMEMYELEVMAH